ncbi:hypothetical protein [Morganella psychrotolerans]|uniref:Uncharacterized protein n=1 Tax=Morganella psychrotolerans TaxID=368603 RepID=A0A1B8H3Y1_9GAMM|nr:hypothetical protein [Morganella psychrotolerans]OBU03780.1 hypothetical protein AYY17_09415 [Morganella psychrotolerans]
MTLKKHYTFIDNDDKNKKYYVEIDDYGEEITIYLEKEIIGNISLNNMDIPNNKKKFLPYNRA